MTTDEQIKHWKERAEKAEASCAEMRNYVSNLTASAQNQDVSEDEWNALEQYKTNALSSDCGKGWLSPERAGKLREASMRLRDYCIEHPEKVTDIPDEIWCPFNSALEDTK